MGIATTIDLVTTIRGLGLSEGLPVERLYRLVEEYSTAEDLCSHLVQQHWLTPFQSQQLIRGRGPSLRLGPYLLLERIGAGGTCEVFKARHAQLHRIVALKVVAPQHLGHPVALERFRREVKAAAQLAHPNIVAVHDAGESGGTHYLAMELIEGIDLCRLVQQAGPLPLPLACDFLRQACLGLQHAHEQGFIHRDIKPSNLLVTDPLRGPGGSLPPGGSLIADRFSGGTVKILDMGLVRLNTPVPGQDDFPLTEQGVVLGTMDYLAPEQAKDPRNAGPRSDLYSLGCSLYHLLTGQVPFPGGLPLDKLLRHQMDPPTPVTTLRADVPLELEQLVSRLMEKAPEDRFTTAAEVAEALTRLIERLGWVIVPPPSERGITPAPLTRPYESHHALDTFIPPGDVTRHDSVPSVAARPRGRPWLAITLMAGVLLVLVLTAAFWLPRPTPTNPPIPPPHTGEALADYCPADAAGLVGLRPARLSGSRDNHLLPRLGEMLSLVVPAFPGRQGTHRADEVRIVWHTGDVLDPVFLVRDEMGLAPPCGGQPVPEQVEYRDRLSGRRYSLLSLPPYLVASTSLNNVLAARTLALHPEQAADPDDRRLRHLLHKADRTREMWLLFNLDRLGKVPPLPEELEPVVRPVLDHAVAVEGGLRVEANRIHLEMQFTASGEESVERLEQGLQGVRDYARDREFFRTDLSRRLEPGLTLLRFARITRQGQHLRLEAAYPPGNPGQPGGGTVPAPGL